MNKQDIIAYLESVKVKKEGLFTYLGRLKEEHFYGDVLLGIQDGHINSIQVTETHKTEKKDLM